MTETIDKFEGDYAFLSNFFPVEITFDRKLYPSVEHAYQAAKTLNKFDRARIAEAPTPGAAKRLGRKVKLRSDWDKIKRGIMRQLIQKKFEYHTLREKLLDTEDAILIEGNYWGDTYWGVCNGVGHNYLGKILMDERDRLMLTAE